MMDAELEDRCRELENTLSMREAELFEARRQNTTLRTQLTAAQAGTWMPVEPGTELDLHDDGAFASLTIGGDGRWSVEEYIDDEAHTCSMPGWLPDGYAFCRRVPAAPDPLAHLVPPLSEWPDDAVAWCIDGDGLQLWVRVQPSSLSRWTVYGHFVGSYSHWAEHDAPVTLPSGFNWRDSLRIRPQPEVTP